MNQILFRASRDEAEELSIAKNYFDVRSCRTELKDSLVIGRYSVLPYYKELEDDLAVNGCRLLNSYEQHKFIADVFEWASEDTALFGLTPKTYRTWGELPEGAYVVKGRTNSRKNQWNTHMFAPNKYTIQVIAANLLQDSLIADQGLVVREYVPLKKFDTGINGHPVTNEWRCFFYKNFLLASGYYWVNFPDAQEKAVFSPEGRKLAMDAAARVAPYANFFVLDVAETESGDWIVIEVNDGQMSGLSGCDPEILYSNLKAALDVQADIDHTICPSYVGKT